MKRICQIAGDVLCVGSRCKGENDVVLYLGEIYAKVSVHQTVKLDLKVQRKTDVHGP